MGLNKEKLQLSTLRFTLRRQHYLLKKKIEDTARFKRTKTMVKARLGRWVQDGKYRIKYNSMDDILEDLGLTADELSLFCAKEFGKKFLTWRKELRMEDAKNLLLSYPDTPACKIGSSLGITDKSDFRQQFKSVTGMTPSEWREKNSKKN